MLDGELLWGSTLDVRRAPATYDRILKHIAGHRIIVHCTVTRQMLARPGYLDDFCRFWSDRPEVRKIWFSIYTPQENDRSPERLRPQDRETLFQELSATVQFPKVHLPRMVLDGYRNPPRSPAECTFARLNTCLSADLKTPVTPCQLGGKPARFREHRPGRQRARRRRFLDGETAHGQIYPGRSNRQPIAII